MREGLEKIKVLKYTVTECLHIEVGSREGT